MNYAPTLYFLHRTYFVTQSPTLRDLNKGWQPLQDSKQEIDLFKYMKTLYYKYGDSYFNNRNKKKGG